MFGLNLKHQRLSVLLALSLLFLSQSCNGEVKKRVCLGTNSKFVKLGTTEEHYSLLKEMYSYCEVVLGNLEITHLQPHHDPSFLKEIKEVGGYVLISDNAVKSIPLVNLRIIRGNNLYKNSALYISSNFDEKDNAHGLEMLPMRQLQEILQGGVTIARNPRLCNLDTIKWKDIVHSDNHIDIKKDSLSHCPRCLEKCSGSCWGPGPENCQILTKLMCAPQCPGRCRGPNPSDCCHSQCAAGCTGPRETDCLACLTFQDSNTCLESCSSMDAYNLNKNLVEAGHIKYGCGSTCVRKCPNNYIVSDFGTCEHACGTFENDVHSCKKSSVSCELDLKHDQTRQVTIKDAIKQNIYIITTEKESHNITSKLDKPKLDIFNPIGDKKVCTGSINGISQMASVNEHYQLMKSLYQGCEIVLGNLEITHLPSNADVSFLKDIEEVGGYVLIALNTMKSIPLVNLRIIRGETLYNNNALAIFSNYQSDPPHGVEELPMRQLQEIIRGEILIKNNPYLCNLHTIKWEDILSSNYRISVEGNSHENFTKLICDKTCAGRCRGPMPSDCCDHKCAAGCTGPKDTDCLACLLVRDNHDKCLEYCPPLPTVTNKHPVEKKKRTNSCVVKCPHDYMVTDSGTCVQKCSEGTYMAEEYGVYRCKKCDGPCPEGKICDGIGYGKLRDAIAINASNIDNFENCTIVVGSIFIMYSTIHGDRYTNASAMDPAKLNVFKSVREITGYLVVNYLPENFTDLSIFENLEVIRGRPKYLWKYSVGIGDLSISSLGLKSLQQVSDGDVVITKSKDLCFSNTINWSRILRSRLQRVKISNKSPEDCVSQGKICDPSCSDGCWGPGPSQCFSLHNKECVS
ncbi:epidermal growth factor receptor-like isoform X2 [Engystomops pustulosus]|uniref:epidermal growth factor receptor-like isoform X2 n=1 Tax=Engystomops pustulosus TaxID=76066 RepID=UPI003AFACEF7